MVPNPTKSIIAETQARLTDIIRELEKNLSRLIMLVGDKAISASVERYTLIIIGITVFARSDTAATIDFIARVCAAFMRERRLLMPVSCQKGNL